MNTQAFVVSDDTTLVNPNNVIARGSILNDGCTPVASYGIEYSGINGFVAGTGTKSPSTNLSGTSFSSSLTGLVQNTAYYYRLMPSTMVELLTVHRRLSSALLFLPD